MSDIVEKTFSAIPRLISHSLFRGTQKDEKLQQQCLVSSELEALFKAVNAARGHSEEAVVIREKLQRLKERLEEPSASVDLWCHLLPTAVFCSMMGYDASFASIFALKLSAIAKGQQKRAGYMAATMLLTPQCSITILSFSTMNRDLHSSSILDNIMALSAAAELVAAEHIPLMLPVVVKLLRHHQALVRARAVSCIDAFFRKAPSLMQPVLSQVKGMLGDKEPSVLSALVTLIAQLPQEFLAEFASVGPGLINMLMQVRSNKFGDTNKYKGMPLPWLQIKLLRVLARLSSSDLALAERMVPVLSQMLEKIADKEPIELAIVEECLTTVAALVSLRIGTTRSDRGVRSTAASSENEVRAQHPNSGGKAYSLDATTEAPGPTLNASQRAVEDFLGSHRPYNSVERRKNDGPEDDSRVSPSAFMSLLDSLINKVSRVIGRFLKSHNSNLRYLGVQILARLTAPRPDMAAPHQIEVVQCLGEPDPIIRRMTLTLLHNMANRDNFEAVCSTMLGEMTSGMGKSMDSSLKAELAEMVCDIAERFVGNLLWYLNTTLPLLSLCIDSERTSSIVDRMLRFMIQTAQCKQNAVHSDALISHLVGNFVNSLPQSTDVDVPTPMAMFALNALRFVPIQVPKEGLHQLWADFLAACGKLVEMEKVPSRVKEKVVLCIQQLLLRKSLAKGEVLQWVNTVIKKLQLASPPHALRQKLSEVSALASLGADLPLWSTPTDPSMMDLHLSFLDPYILDTCKEGKLLLEPGPQPPAEYDVYQGSLRLQMSPGSQRSGQDGDSGLYADALMYNESSSRHISAPTLSRSIESTTSSVFSTSVISVKQVWSKGGFAGQEDERGGYSTALVQRGQSARQETSSAAQKVGSVKSQSTQDNIDSEKQKLAKALFKGISSNPCSTTELLSDKSFEEASPDPNATQMSSCSSASADADNTVFSLNSSLLPSSRLVETNSQDLLVSSLSGLTIAASAQHRDTSALSGQKAPSTSQGSSNSASLNISAEDIDQAWSSMLSSDTGGWKALHASHMCSPEAEPIQQNAVSRQNNIESDAGEGLSAPAPAPDHTSTDPESGNSLCLSMDSLEDTTAFSAQSSPAKKVKSQSRTSDNVDNMPLLALTEAEISQQLEAEMAEYEKAEIAAQNNSPFYNIDCQLPQTNNDGAASLFTSPDQSACEILYAETTLENSAENYKSDHLYSGFVESAFETSESGDKDS